MTTTFHLETNEPQYGYSYEGAEVQLCCQGLIAVAAGPTPAFDEHVSRSWFELSPVNGKRMLAGVGRSLPSGADTSVFETRETIWANAMAGLAPLELAEASAPVADCAYALVDSTIGRVELGRSGCGTSALIFDGSETRLVQPASSTVGVGHSASFELPAGSTLLLLTHDPAERARLVSIAGRTLGARSVRGDEVEAVLDCCLELRNGPLSQCESIVALYFKRLDGSAVMRSPSDLPPTAGNVVNGDSFVTDDKSKAWLHQSKRRGERCRRRVAGMVATPEL